MSLYVQQETPCIGMVHIMLIFSSAVNGGLPAPVEVVSGEASGAVSLKKSNMQAMYCK